MTKDELIGQNVMLKQMNGQLNRTLDGALIENESLCAFLNRELKMTASDPRIKKLVKEISKKRKTKPQ